MVVISNNPEHQEPPRQLSKEEEEALIERLGGAEALKKSFADAREVSNRFREDWKVLIEQYPNKWVIVGKGGLIAAVDSPEEARDFAKKNDLESSQFMIQYLDPDPLKLIL